MKKSSLVFLLVAAVALIALSVFTAKSRRPSAGTSSKKVFTTFIADGLEQVVVTSPDKRITLAVQGERWVCTNAMNYPIQFDKLRTAVMKLEELKGQTVTADAARRDALKMNLPSSGKNKDTLGTLVELHAANGKPVASLLLGEQRMRKPRGGPEDGMGGYPDGRYVSADGGNTIYLIGDPLDDFPSEEKSWLDTELTSLYSTDVDKITIGHPGQPEILLAKPAGKTTFEVQGLGPDEETDDVKASSTAGVFSYLRFDELASPAISDEQAGLKDPIVFQAVSVSGEVYTASIGATTKAGDSDARYVRLKVSLPDVTIDATNTNAVNARRDLEKKVAALNAKFAGWTYVIASYKADSMAVKRDSIVKKKANPATTNETAAATVSAAPKAEAPQVEVAPAAPKAEETAKTEEPKAGKPSSDAAPENK